MLTLTIEDTEFFNETIEEYVPVKGQTLELEHSLISLSKWESKWGQAWLGRKEKTAEQAEDYIVQMTLTRNVNPLLYQALTPAHYKEVADYINRRMTATWFTENPNEPPSSEVVTAELIYYWMIALEIPFECQKWHLDRLLTLIQVCNRKNQPPKKVDRREALERQRALNAARRAQYNSKG